MEKERMSKAFSPSDFIGNIRSLVTPPIMLPGANMETSFFYVKDYGSTEREIAVTYEQAQIIRFLQRHHLNKLTVQQAFDLYSTNFQSHLDLESFFKNIQSLRDLELMGSERLLAPEQRRSQRELLSAAVKEMQTKKLKELVTWSKRTIPFYSNRFSCIDESRINVSDLSYLPLMTKKDLRKNLPHLIDSTPQQITSIKWHTSSGTTDNRQYLQAFEGISADHKVFPVASLNSPLCSGKECHMDMDLTYEERWDGIQLRLNSAAIPSDFSEQKLLGIVEEMQSLQVATFLGNASYMVAVALFMLKNDLSVPSVRTIILGDEVQSNLHKYWLKRAFNCPIIEMYGMSELSPVAFECSAGRMHVLTDSMLVEILSSDMKSAAKDDELGQIVITTLDKYVMPFIRYKSEDLACGFKSDCPCGSSFPSFGRIEGRASDLIISQQDNVITPRQVDAIVSQITKYIGWYTLIQHVDGKLSFHYVPLKNNTPFPSTRMKSALMELIGGDAEIDVVASPSLAPSASGKFRICYRETQEEATYL